MGPWSFMILVVGSGQLVSYQTIGYGLWVTTSDGQLWQVWLALASYGQWCLVGEIMVSYGKLWLEKMSCSMVSRGSMAVVEIWLVVVSYGWVNCGQGQLWSVMLCYCGSTVSRVSWFVLLRWQLSQIWLAGQLLMFAVGWWLVVNGWLAVA